MQIVCPSCAAAYEVPDGMLAAPRTVRCARCGREWWPAPATLDEASRIEPADTMPGTPSLVEPTPKRPAAGVAAPLPTSGSLASPAWLWSRDPVFLARIGWAGSLLLLLFLAWAAYAWRGAIIHVWPPSERLYLALGIA